MDQIMRPPTADIAASPVAVQQYIFALEQRLADLQSGLDTSADAIRRIRSLADAALRNGEPADRQQGEAADDSTPLLYEL